MITATLPATDHGRKEIRENQADEICPAIVTYCSKGWTEINYLPSPLKPYWAYRDELNLNHKGLLLCGQCIVLAANLRVQVLEQLHTGHQCITKCCQWEKQSVWWPGLNTHLAARLQLCKLCSEPDRACRTPYNNQTT